MGWGDKLEDGGRKRAEGPERYPSLRGAGLQESWNRAEQERAIQSLYHRHHINNLHQRSCTSQSVPSTDPGGRCQEASLSPVRERPSQAPDSMLVYDEVLQQHRRLLSKLDLEERRRREAREGGEQGDGGGRREGVDLAAGGEVIGRRDDFREWLLVPLKLAYRPAMLYYGER